jgi:protein TonB
MSRPLVTRASSLAASTGLLALAIAGALSVSTTIQQWIARDPPPVVSFAPETPTTPPPPIPHPTIQRHEQQTVDPQTPPQATPQTDQISTTITPPTDIGPATITDPRWLAVPRDLTRYYPRRAIQMNIEGSATLDCLVDTGGRLACAVVAETPSSWGFGQAALAISRDYRMAPALRDGRPVAGRYRMRVPFQITQR